MKGRALDSFQCVHSKEIDKGIEESEKDFE